MSTETEMRGLGFHKAGSTRAKRRLIMSIEGHEKGGKSHFALTAPAPIAMFDFNTGLEGVVEKFSDQKEIHIGDYKDLELSTTLNQGEYGRLWQRRRDQYIGALENDNIRSLVFDTATEDWDLIRLARLGSLALPREVSYKWGPINAEYRELFRKIANSDKNLIMIHKLRKEYKDDNWSGKYERAGFNDIGGMVQLNTSIRWDLETREFILYIRNCRHNPELNDTELSGLMCSFPFLAASIFPDTQLEDWE